MVDRASQVSDIIVAAGLNQDLHTFNALTSTCGRSRKLQNSFELLKHMTTCYGLEPDLHTWNSPIDECGEAKRISEALAVYQDMCSDGVEPCVVT